MIPEFDYYLFDADGTLLDTQELIYQCFSNTARVTNHQPLDRETICRHTGLTLNDQFALYYGLLESDTLEKYRAIHMNHQLEIYPKYLRLFDGVAETLEKLRSKGKHCAIVTSRMSYTLELYLTTTGIKDCFDVLITPECTSKHKPNPEPAFKALELLGGSVDRSIFIGDALFDIECGTKAGMDTAFCTWSHVPAKELTTAPTYLINTMNDLTNW